MTAAATIHALRQRIRQIEAPARHGVLPFGVAAIDAALPGGGVRLGAVHEILGSGGDEEDGAAPAGFAAGILARLSPPGVIPGRPAGPDPEPMNTGLGPTSIGPCSWVPDSRTASAPRNDDQWRAKGSGPILWCLKRPDLYGSGLAAHGLDPARLVVVTARRDDDILWAVEEGLREPGLAAVVGEIGRLPMVAGRRLQLAAERSGVTVFLLRRWQSGAEAGAERERPTAALTRWRIAALPSSPAELSLAQVNPLPARAGRGFSRDGRRTRWGLGLGRPRWRVELLRVRGGVPEAWDVEVADATGLVSLPAGLADRPAAPTEQKNIRDRAEPRRRAG